MAKENLRALSLDVIMEVLEKQGFSNQVLNAMLSKYQYLEKQERSFITRLSLGTIEKATLLDAIINTYSKTKVKKQKPVIRNILRLSVYQIYFMDNVPESAIVNEAVKLAKKRGFAGLSGFVNGTLRSVIREQKPLSEFENESLGLRYSMPDWIVEKWSKDYGEEKTKEILQGFSREKGITVRTDVTKISPEKLKTKLTEEGMKVSNTELPYAFVIEDFDYLEKSESFRDGLFYVQDLSSMEVAENADLFAGARILDVCAAPGGKSIHMGEVLQMLEEKASGESASGASHGSVEARDVSAEKVGIIEENIARTGRNNVTAKVMDATVFDEASVEAYDRVICDLPCSGLGVIGKKPEIRYRVQPEDILSLQSLQREILTNAVRYVKPGGKLVYSTCTITREENEDNVAWLTATYPQLKLLSSEQFFPESNIRDGFYVAVFG